MSILNQLALNNFFFYYYTYFFNTLSNKILSLNHLYFFVNRMKSTKSCYLKKNPIKYLLTQYWIVVFQFDSAWTHWKIGELNGTIPGTFIVGGGGLSNEYLSSYSIEHFYVMTLITKQNLPSWSILCGFLFVILPLTSNLI